MYVNLILTRIRYTYDTRKCYFRFDHQSHTHRNKSTWEHKASVQMIERRFTKKPDIHSIAKYIKQSDPLLPIHRSGTPKSLATQKTNREIDISA